MSGVPVISVIIPVYNTDKYLRRCLDGLLNQTFDNWQAICVNDGSTDNSATILDEYAARDKRFIIVKQKNAGQSMARNAAMKLARGEYIMYLDSDDFIHPQTMEILYNLAVRENADMVSFGYDEKFYKYAKNIISRGKDISKLLPNSVNKKYNIGKIKYFVTDDILSHSTERNHGVFSFHPIHRHCFPVLGLYRRELISDLKFIHGIIIEDFPWWASVMLRRPHTVMINLPLYFYMPNATSSLGGARAMRLIVSIGAGLEYTYKLYSKNATVAEFDRFYREFMWPFIITAMRKTGELDKEIDIKTAKQIFTKLYKTGMFYFVPTRRSRRYLSKIQNFISRF